MRANTRLILANYELIKRPTTCYLTSLSMKTQLAWELWLCCSLGGGWRDNHAAPIMYYMFAAQLQPHIVYCPRLYFDKEFESDWLAFLKLSNPHSKRDHNFRMCALYNSVTDFAMLDTAHQLPCMRARLLFSLRAFDCKLRGDLFKLYSDRAFPWQPQKVWNSECFATGYNQG